jgi:hypothetical protein
MHDTKEISSRHAPVFHAVRPRPQIDVRHWRVSRRRAARSGRGTELRYRRSRDRQNDRSGVAALRDLRLADKTLLGLFTELCPGGGSDRNSALSRFPAFGVPICRNLDNAHFPAFGKFSHSLMANPTACPVQYPPRPPRPHLPPPARARGRKQGRGQGGGGTGSRT